MKKLTLEIDTEQAREKLEQLSADVEKFKTLMVAAQKQVDVAANAMREFADACSNITVDVN